MIQHSSSQAEVPQSLLAQVTRALIQDRGVVPGLSNWRRRPAQPGTRGPRG